MNRKTQPMTQPFTRPSRPRAKMSTPVVLALLGLVGTIAAAILNSPVIIEWIKTGASTPTPTMEFVAPPLETQSAPSASTRAPIVNSNSLNAERLEICAHVDAWIPFTSIENLSGVKDGECWQLLEYGISAKNGDMKFFKTLARSGAYYGLSTPLNGDADITFDLIVSNLNANTELIVGVINGADPNANGVLLAIKPNQFFSTRVMRKGLLYNEPNDNIRIPYDQFKPVRVRLVLSGNQLKFFIINESGQIKPAVEVPFAERRLFLGYFMGRNSSLDVEIINLNIVDK